MNIDQKKIEEQAIEIIQDDDRCDVRNNMYNPDLVTSMKVSWLLELSRKEKKDLVIQDCCQIYYGTIDKFQGMEAPITIISMTSSSVEDLPRNKKFFFNRNRLNVAISRAQCSSIILMNPKLLETPPSDYEEFKLLNYFQKLMKFEKKIAIN